jgi:hypothetical protein
MRSRIEERVDRLIVRCRPRPSWGEIVFLAAWLVLSTFVLWTLFGDQVLTLTRSYVERRDEPWQP